MKNHLTALIILSVLFFSCNKKDEATPDPAPTTPATTASKSYENVTFDRTNVFFSTDGSMTSPVDSTQAKLITSKIDITFIYDMGYSGPGFFDPKARSQNWTYSSFDMPMLPWLSNAVETRYYSTNLTQTQFEAAKADQSLIATYFADASVVLAPHPFCPTGSIIGGRYFSPTPHSIAVSQGDVFFYKNTTSGKRGLLYIRTDQYNLWPAPIYNSATKVDIIREN